MFLKRVAIQNVRSFLDRAELSLDGTITIIIGPNGGGKTNLLDTIMVMLRRYLFASMYAAADPTPDSPNRYVLRANDTLNNMTLERHSRGAGLPQIVEAEVEVTENDIQNMLAMKKDADPLTKVASKKYFNFDLAKAEGWNLDRIRAGMRFTFTLENSRISHSGDPAATAFLEYLQLFEMDGRMREEFDFAPLATPLIYLPVNRTTSGFDSRVELAGYDDFQIKRNSDAASSRNAPQFVSLAVGRMAQKYRMLLERDNGNAASEFRKEKNHLELTRLLGELGYEWTLETINALKNQYDVKLTKQGSSFLVSAASSGERELFTYLFAIYALNVRNALIVIDEPELHLHPKWQKTLLQLFIRLAESTENQFLLATHSPTFVSPQSIQYVSRVFSQEQRSRILRLNTTGLPDERHLLNIINSQNNERLFFADEVILVEGVSDRIFFEALLDRFGRSESSSSILEVISVGGKGLFEAYSKVLEACQIKYSIIADLDYVEQIGTLTLKNLFKIDGQDIKKDVLENVKSHDGEALIAAIDEAISSGSWKHAGEIWDYIKSRRRHLRGNLKKEEAEELQRFIEQKQAERVFILSRGTLESYLPSGHSSKDLGKLIQFLSDTGFWNGIKEAGRHELESIAMLLLRRNPAVVDSKSTASSTGGSTNKR